MPKTKKLKLKILGLISSLVGIIFTWGLLVPAFEFPDEQAHFGTVSFLLENNRLPNYKEKDMTQEMYKTQEFLGIKRDEYGNNQYTYHPEHTVEYTTSNIGKHELEIINLNNIKDRSTYTKDEAARYPPLYYQFSTLFLNLVNNQDILTRLFVVRIGSLFIAAAMALTLFKIGILIFKNQQLALTLTTITMIQPMISFVTAGINSDNLYNLLFMVIIYLSLKTLKEGVNIKNLLATTFTIMATIYTKPQGVIAIPITLLALMMKIIKERRWKLLGWVIFISFCVLGLGWGQLPKYISFINISNSNGESFIDFLRFSTNKLVTQNIVWYWGVFKWLGVVLPPIYWRVANRVVLLSVVGLVFYFYKVFKKKKTIIDPLLTSFLILTATIYAGMIFWIDWQYLKGWGFSIGVQARYFFPTIVTHMALMQTGLLSIGWNKTSQNWIRRGLILLFFWLQLGGIWTVIKSYYSTVNLNTLIIQISQYKPLYAKSSWWYLWFGLYLLSLIYLLVKSLKARD